MPIDLGTGNNLFNGTGIPDDVFGNDGNDTLRGFGGADTLDGGNGNDSINGGDDQDVLSGAAGNDTLDGGNGNDTVNGGEGRDSIRGGLGEDLIDAGNGNDSADGGDGNDTVFGGEGNDSLDGSAGDDSIDGGNGNDSIEGDAGNDTALGGEGRDLILGGGGADLLEGGGDNDAIDGGTENDTITGGEGRDSLDGDSGNDSIDGGNGNDTVEGDVGDDTVTAGPGNDSVIGGSGADSLDGGEGKDTLSGGNGNDTFIGGFGNDTLNGGNGVDCAVYFGAEADYSVVVSGGTTFVTDLNLADGDEGTDRLSSVEQIKFLGIGGNTDPDAVDDTNATNENATLVAAAPGVLANDTDADGDSLSVTGFDATSALGASVVVNVDGSYSYDPSGAPNLQALSASGSTTDSFTYTIDDGNGGSDTATAFITVSGVNDPPVAEDDEDDTDEDTIVTGNVLNDNGNGPDSDIDGDNLSVNPFTLPSVNVATVSVKPDGSYSYDPTSAPNLQALDDGESLVDRFTYEIIDGHGGFDVATVYITVSGVNDPPVATDNAYFGAEGTYYGNVITDDTGAGVDSDVDGDSLTASLDSGPTSGSLFLNPDGSFTYTPFLFGGTVTDSFTYTVSDGTAISNIATVTLEINTEGT